jgi:DNA-directed RNA polymerase specialized sigma24 family protein
MTIKTHHPPYYRHPLTGKSATFEWVKNFFATLFSPAYITNVKSKKTEWTPPLYFRLIDGKDSLIALQENVYKNKPHSPIKQYLGRASHVASSINVHETAWCELADVVGAVKKLDQRTRIFILHSYLYGEDDATIAKLFNVSESTVTYSILEGLRRVAQSLDKIDNDSL